MSKNSPKRKSSTSQGEPTAKSLLEKKSALERGEHQAGRVFELKRRLDGSVERVEIDASKHRQKISVEWSAKTEVVRARQSLNLTQEGFAGLLGIGISTLRSWEQGKREPSGAARVLISIAVDHPDILEEARRKSA